MREQVAIFVAHFGPKPESAETKYLNDDMVEVRLTWSRNTITVDRMLPEAAKRLIDELYGDNAQLVYDYHRSKST